MIFIETVSKNSGGAAVGNIRFNKKTTRKHLHHSTQATSWTLFATITSMISLENWKVVKPKVSQPSG